MMQRNPFDQFDTPDAGPQVVIPVAPSVAAKDAAELRAAERRAAREAAELPYVAPKAAAELAKAQADAEKARRDVAAGQATANPQQQRLMQALADDEVIAAIEAARGRINGWSAGYPARLPSMLQPQSAVDLAGDISTVSSRITLDTLGKLKQASPTGASGLGSLTEREGALLRDSVAGLAQEQSPEKLREALAKVEKHYRNVRALMAGEDYRDPAVAERYGIAPEPTKGSTGEQAFLARGAMRTEADPALRGVNDRIRGMIGAGRPANEIVAYMNSVQPGLGDQRASDVTAAVRYRAQNPTVPLERYPISVENRQVPMSATRQTLNTIAQSPGGAFGMAAWDALSGGYADNMTGNPALTRAAMGAVARENPGSTLAGTLAGGAVAGTALEGAAAGLGLARLAPVAADAAYGALYGSGTADEGSRLSGALSGAVVGTGGGMLGRRGARAVGSGLQGVRNESVQMLRERGVPMTLGQMVGQSGRLGRYIKGREDRLAGFSGVGDQIGARRLEGIRAFNRAAFDEALTPIGRQGINQTGEQGIEAGRDAVSAAYNTALRPVRLTADPQFATDLAPIAQRAATLPEPMAGNARYTLNTRVGNAFDTSTGAPVMDGNRFQQAIRGLEGDARSLRNEAYGADFGGIARDARGALENMLERQSPGTLDDYLSANAAYRNLSVLGDAVGAGMNTGGLFSPAQLGTAARGNARKFTGRLSGSTTDRPFYDLQRAGQDVLPSKVPDSGTAGRADAGGEGLTAMLRRGFRNVRNAPIYAESTQPALGALLLDRTPEMIRLGEQIERRARIGGMLGRPAALQYGPFAVVPGY